MTRKSPVPQGGGLRSSIFAISGKFLVIFLWASVGRSVGRLQPQFCNRKFPGIFLQFSRQLSQLELTLPDRNPAPPPLSPSGGGPPTAVGWHRPALIGPRWTPSEETPAVQAPVPVALVQGTGGGGPQRRPGPLRRASGPARGGGGQGPEGQRKEDREDGPRTE